MLELTIKGIPRPKQSFRFTKKGIKFQPAEVKEEEMNFKQAVVNQLPAEFVPYSEPVMAFVEYIFPPLKGFTKKKLAQMEESILFKHTKPDVTDNLNKGTFDAMNGIVYIDDSLVVSLFSVKYYGHIPMTRLLFDTDISTIINRINGFIR
jgi:Holliday junction resolvase RusA-like endonuclease